MKNIEEIKRKFMYDEGIRKMACKSTGLSRNALMRKLNNPKKLTLSEVVSLKSVFNLSLNEAINIFAPGVANYNEGEEEND